MRMSILLLVITVMALFSGCNSEKKVAAEPTAERQPTTATITPVVQEQPTMFEHNCPVEDFVLPRNA